MMIETAERVENARQMNGSRLISSSSDPEDLIKKALLILRTPLKRKRRPRGSSPASSTSSVNFSPCCVDLNISLTEDDLDDDIISDDPQHRLSLLSSTFCSAAELEAVWNRFLPSDAEPDAVCNFFLPSDCLDIIARSDADLDVIRSFPSRKELYLYLSDNHFLIDNGTKSFWVDKWSGKKSYMLAARELNIAWHDSPEYWRWKSFPGSRFREVAELLDVCWLHIWGKIETQMLSPNTTYAAYLIFTTKSGLQGFGYQLADASFGITGQDNKTLHVCLDPIVGRKRRYQNVGRKRRYQPTRFGQQHMTESDKNAKVPEQRNDGWMEIELGEFFVEETKDVELQMHLKEINCGHWKSGLIVEGIEIRPKRVK